MTTYRKVIREHCPQIPWLRQILARIRLKAYNHDLVNWDTVQLCIDDPSIKKHITHIYSSKWQKRANEVIKESMDYGIDPAHYEDVLFANFAYGMRAEEFMYYDLANKSESERSTFLSDKKYSEYTVRMNNLFDADIFYNKANSYKLMKKYYHRDALAITGTTNINDIEAFINKHPIFVKKIGKSSLGKGVLKVDLTDLSRGGVLLQ